MQAMVATSDTGHCISQASIVQMGNNAALAHFACMACGLAQRGTFNETLRALMFAAHGVYVGLTLNRITCTGRFTGMVENLE